MRTRISTLLIAGSALALGGCAYGDLGLGLGTGYGGYGYGYGSPYYGYGYGSPYYGGYGYGYGGYPYYGSSYGYGMPSYGWYNDYYYPGTGYYVYDTNRRPYVMTTTQRQYWTTRSPALRASSTTTVRPNWSSFNNRQERLQARSDRRAERQATREERKANKPR